MKTNNKGMKTTTATWAFLIALTAIGAGCSSSQPVEALTEEVAPVEVATAPEVQPEIATPAPQVNEEDTAVVPEETPAAADEELPSARLSGAYQLRTDLKQKVRIDEELIEKFGEPAVQNVISARPIYSGVHPDIKIGVAKDGNDDIEYVINLTPEQKQAIYQKFADKILLKEIPQERLKCLLSVPGSSDCED